MTTPKPKSLRDPKSMTSGRLAEIKEQIKILEMSLIGIQKMAHISAPDWIKPMEPYPLCLFHCLVCWFKGHVPERIYNVSSGYNEIRCLRCFKEMLDIFSLSKLRAQNREEK